MGNIEFVLLISETCICVIMKQYKKKLKLFMFDSHSRNAAGKIEDYGYSILLSFSDIENFIEYLCATYFAIMVITCHIICN